MWQTSHCSQPGSREHRSKPEANKPPRSAPPDSLLPVQPWAPKAAFPTQHPQLGTSVQTQESVGHFKSVKSDGGCHGDQGSNKGERLSSIGFFLAHSTHVLAADALGLGDPRLHT